MKGLRVKIKYRAKRINSKKGKVKIPLFLDRNIPQELVNYTHTFSSFKVIKIAGDREKDPELFKEAQKENALIVTRDGDFWENQYDLNRSPGIILIKGDSSSDITHTFGTFCHEADIFNQLRQNSKALTKKKYKINKEGYFLQSLDKNGRQSIEFVKYKNYR